MIEQSLGLVECILMTAKELVKSAIEILPDNATLTDIREELELIEGIEKGLADADAGRHRGLGSARGGEAHDGPAQGQLHDRGGGGATAARRVALRVFDTVRVAS